MDFEPLVVIQCPAKISSNVINWLVDLITRKRIERGAELLAFTLKRNNEQEKHSILVGGESRRLIEAADIMGMQKEYNDGTMREFSADNITGFVNSDDVDAFLTNSEKQKIIYHELSALRADDGDIAFPDPNVKFYDDELIISRLVHKGIIRRLFPLHELEQLDNLKTHWCKSFFSFQPLDKIQQYFGETVAMYFAFLGTYTMFLVPPALLGITTLFYSSPLLIPACCVVNMVWTTVFLEWWKRTGTELAYFWGTYRIEMVEEPRPEFHGELTLNPFTGRSELQYSRKKRYIKIYCISVPVIMTCVTIAALTFLLSRELDAYFATVAKSNTVEWLQPAFGLLETVPKVLYAVALTVLNKIYSKIAIMLNNWENHQLQSTYENHLISKMLVFTFINSFVSLFYVAFYLQDMDLLRSHLATLLITRQVMDNFSETVLPYLMLGYRKKKLLRDPSAFRQSTVSTVIKEQVAIEGSMSEYEGTFNDYTEIWIQFGYVYLFSAVFPLAAFCALVNNIYEIRTDAFKFCKVFRRPFSKTTSGIGVWQVAFEVMSVISVMTNCALVALSGSVNVYLPSYDTSTLILIFVAAEHLIIISKALLAYIIPDVPYFIEKAVAAAEYEYRKAKRVGPTKGRMSACST